MDLTFAFVVVAAMLLILAIRYRRRAGFGGGRTISHDNITLRSQRYGLVGRPDRIVRRGKTIIVEDKKPSARVYESHRVQMGVYMLLVEEHYGVRPPHAVLVLGDGRREEIRNTKQLRERVLDITAQIRKARSDPARPQQGVAIPAKCRACAQRQNCKQRTA